MSIALIIPAAGSGRRLGIGRPKALVDVGGVSLLRRTLGRFVGTPDVIETVIAAPPGFIGEVQATLVGLVWPACDVKVVAGSDSRQASVRCALEALDSDADLVCVHDAARPLVSATTIAAVIAAGRETAAATVASRPADSVRVASEDGATRPLERQSVWLVETPQAFERELLTRAHSRARAMGREATDDAALVELVTGRSVTVVESDGPNLKVTSPEDLKLVRLILGSSGRTARH
jgi:2-C-methyl-D-erythritol 4-phosphate cytidylyltransferase